MKVLNQLILAILALASIYSCSTLQVESLSYDESLDLYVYPINQFDSLIVRDSIGRIITTENFDTFSKELERTENKYDYNLSIEESDKLYNNDLDIVELYTRANRLLKEEEYNQAIVELKELKSIYPDAVKYSDCLFLEATAYQGLDSTSTAVNRFSSFLNYSSQKHSGRFRNYRDYDAKDSIYRSQRKYAKDYISNKVDIAPYETFTELKPCYHYGSFRPGYLINPEDYAERINWITAVVFSNDYANKLSLGYQINRKLFKRTDVNLSIMASKGYFELGGGVPIQLYKSSDNRFGVKASPFFSFSQIDSVKIDNTNYEIKQGFFNAGVKLSVGYYFLPKFSIGAYYTYNIHNKNNPILTDNNNILLWRRNEYDISLFYNIAKKISIKAGIYNGDLVSGILLSGWEIGYNITTPSLILRVDMY
jgi:hypothetical protein